MANLKYSDAPKMNRFYALRSRGSQETSPDVVTFMVKSITLDVYDLFDSGATLSFVTPLVDKKRVDLHNMLHEPFLVSTPVESRLLLEWSIENVLFHYPLDILMLI